MPSNYLSAETAIINRIQATVTDFRVVAPIADLMALENTGTPTPACYVYAVKLDLDIEQGKVWRFVSDYEIIVAVNNSRDSRAAQDSRTSAGSLLKQVVETALVNFNPGDGHETLQLVPSGRAPYYAPAGYVAYFLLYRTFFEVDGYE